MDKETKKSRGFGYISFNEETTAQSAVTALAGIEVEGRALKIDIAGPKAQRNSTTPSGEGRQPTNTKFSIYMGNLDFAVTPVDITNLCESMLGPGTVKDVRLAIDRDSGEWYPDSPSEPSNKSFHRKI